MPFRDVVSLKNDLPKVSILIAVRNEEKNIKQLLVSIDKLDYPKDKLEILIGDDDSTDRTKSILADCQFNHVQLFSFSKESNDCTGKQFVLQKLLQESTGDVLLFTDGDVELNPNWVKAMLIIDQKVPSIKAGVTAVKGDSWFSKFQNIDWLMNQFIINAWSSSKIKLGIWGNNMAANNLIKSLKWPAIDQLEMVEDIALMHEVLAVKGEVIHCFSADHLVLTNPESSFWHLLQQRKRWLNGALDLPVVVIILSVMKLLYLPIVLVLMVSNAWFILLWPIKWGISGLVFMRINKRLRLKPSWIQLLLFDLYEIIVYISTFVFFILPISVEWKGRKY